MENRVQIKALLVDYCVISTLLCVIGQPFFLNGMKRKKKIFHLPRPLYNNISMFNNKLLSMNKKRGYKKYLF